MKGIVGVVQRSAFQGLDEGIEIKIHVLFLNPLFDLIALFLFSFEILFMFQKFPSLSRSIITIESFRVLTE